MIGESQINSLFWLNLLLLGLFVFLIIMTISILRTFNKKSKLLDRALGYLPHEESIRIQNLIDDTDWDRL